MMIPIAAGARATTKDRQTWMLTRKSAWDLRMDHASAMDVAWHFDFTVKQLEPENQLDDSMCNGSSHHS